ncbi:Yip1 family protein [Leptospira noguchii]|uniref:Yip1 domain protein n=1 Tax=Leptospira noguchii str. 2001034031 TaxID=1193053 RepID=M6Y599_9LEPT|nr:Yip1 family protein [Leptospira noguchii]EMO88880.1 Yip1 domain protein [Leptospira noguchii str. 2001034031]
MPKFSFSFTNTIEEARDVLIKPASYFKNLSKTPEESLISLYLRCLVYMGFLYVVAVIGMTLFAPKGFLNPPLTLLFLEMPTAYLISSIIVFPILGFIYMFFSWICGGNTDWKKNFRASTAIFSTFWAALFFQSFGGYVHFYLGLGIGIVFTAYIPFLFYLALTSYLQAPIKRTVVVLSGFALVLLYLQYSKMDSYIKDHKIREDINFHKPLTKEEKPQIKPEAVEKIIREAMEKAKTTKE